MSKVDLKYVKIVQPIKEELMIFIHTMYLQNTYKKYCKIVYRDSCSTLYAYKNFIIKAYTSYAYNRDDTKCLQLLQEYPYYPKLYFYFKDKYMVIEKRKGVLFPDLVRTKIQVHPNWLDKIKEAYENAFQKGIYVEEIYGKNILFDQHGLPFIIDVGNFRMMSYAEIRYVAQMGYLEYIETDLEGLFCIYSNYLKHKKKGIFDFIISRFTQIKSM